jgi:hypothetical protein
VDLLNQLLDLARQQSSATPEERSAALRALLAEQPDVDLDALQAAAIEQFEGLSGQDDFTDAELAEMEALADVTEAVQAEITAAAETRDANRQRAADLASRVQNAAGDPDGTDPNADPGTDPGSDPGADPDGADPDGPAGTGDGDPQAVAAGGARRVPLRSIRSSNVTPKRGSSTYSVVAAADINGVPAGAELDGLDAAADAVVRKMASMARLGPNRTMQAGIFSLRRNTPEELTVREESDYEPVLYATDEKRLAGGSLVAAGGWCAPSEILYDLCPGATEDGMVDLPSVTIRRGGVRWPAVPDFSAVYSATGFIQTEAQNIANAAKPCYDIPCPTFGEARLDAIGLCLRAGILQNVGYPEMIRYFVEESLKAHAHKVNREKIARAAALATAVTVTPPGTGDAPYGPGATASLLGLIELQVTDLRYKYRLAREATIELIMPDWLDGVLRSDLAKRTGVDLLNVTDAQVTAWLNLRGVAPQRVYDWQDSLATGVATDMGGSTPPKVWPATVQLLMYPAGTYFVGQADIITLDGIYDSVNTLTNTYTALFSEEGLLVGKRCYDARLLTVPLCANGATGPAIAVGCPAA